MVPYNVVGAVSLTDPPLVITDMTVVAMDPLGRLESFHAIPPQHDPQTAPAPPADWSVVFRLAGLDQARFTPATPEWLPRGEADTRMAWTGTSAERPETPLRLEAAAWRGRITFLQTVWPWTRATRMQEAPISQAMRVMSGVNVAFFFVLLVAALIVSRKNVKAGRGDHRGALRLVAIAARRPTHHVGLQRPAWWRPADPSWTASSSRWARHSLPGLALRDVPRARARRASVLAR